MLRLLFHSCLIFAIQASELPEWHLKPLGSHIKPNPVDETFADNIISPKEFAEKYVLPRKPIVFRNVVKTWPAYKLWTDEYLAEKYGDMEMRLEGKKEKGSSIPKGDICLGRDHLKTFLKEYKEGANKYVVSDLPAPMWNEVHMLPSMACGDFVENFVEIDIWINSDMGKKGRGGNSILHKDAFNTVNCVVNGTKEWKLIELQYNDYVYQSWEAPNDAGYGGFSIVDPEKVDAKKFPDVGKIPRWQFVTVNAGDCLHLPSQMWHQVKSFGETNRAVAFLFSQFNDVNQINTKNCPETPSAVPLSEVDVDWPYSGTGIMPMGNMEMPSFRDTIKGLVNETTGYITKRSTYRSVFFGHENGAKNKELMLQNSKDMYFYFLNLAGGEKKKMTREFLQNLTKAEIRPSYKWLSPVEPANSYEHEYSAILPEDIEGMLQDLKEQHDGVITRKGFFQQYANAGGTEKFGEDIWQGLAGDKDEVSDVSETFKNAVKKYEYHRRSDPELEDVDDDAVIYTPQGHKSVPKKMQGGYSRYEDGEKNPEEKLKTKKVEL